MNSRSALRTINLGLAASALSLASAAAAQDVNLPPLPGEDIQSLPADLQTAPVPNNAGFPSPGETITDVDGIETITRTRRIDSTLPVAHSNVAAVGSTQAVFSPAAQVFEREQWIEECNRRTNGRSEREKGGIIGGLLGAIAGGIIGNRVADGERLGGTLIGAGVGGLGGLLLGNLIGGGKRGDRYDCEAALDSYLSQYGTGPVRIASRAIPAQGSIAAPVGAPVFAYPQQGFYAPVYSYAYAPPQQIVYVPIRYEQQQRVVVRETVREETVEVPGARRVIDPAPVRAPLPVKQPTRVRPAPSSPKLIKQ